MVDLGSYYSIAADEIACVSVDEKSGTGFPFTLTVTLKSGEKYSVAYQSREGRDAAKLNLVLAIERERKRDGETILQNLHTALDELWRLDKRMYRMEKRLKWLPDEAPKATEQKLVQDCADALAAPGLDKAE